MYIQYSWILLTSISEIYAWLRLLRVVLLQFRAASGVASALAPGLFGGLLWHRPWLRPGQSFWAGVCAIGQGRHQSCAGPGFRGLFVCSGLALFRAASVGASALAPASSGGRAFISRARAQGSGVSSCVRGWLPSGLLLLSPRPWLRPLRGRGFRRILKHPAF